MAGLLSVDLWSGGLHTCSVSVTSPIVLYSTVLSDTVLSGSLLLDASAFRQHQQHSSQSKTPLRSVPPVCGGGMSRPSDLVRSSRLLWAFSAKRSASEPSNLDHLPASSGSGIPVKCIFYCASLSRSPPLESCLSLPFTYGRCQNGTVQLFRRVGNRL